MAQVVFDSSIVQSLKLKGFWHPSRQLQFVQPRLVVTHLHRLQLPPLEGRHAQQDPAMENTGNHKQQRK
jgi:hypothetical protein